MSEVTTNVSTSTNTGWETALNALLVAFIPYLNKQLPPLIVSEGYDPWAKVVSGDDTLGKINLGICTAKVKASYSIKNMKGLSSLQVKTATVSNLSGTADKVTGTLTMSMSLSSNLKADVSGSVKASCGSISEKAGISGDVKATGVTGTATGTFVADLDGNVCMDSATISKLSLKYKDIDVNIDGLGFFNSFTNELVDAIDALFGDAIEGEISDALKPVFNDLLKDLLPYCVAA
jgi:hypothetical protein